MSSLHIPIMVSSVVDALLEPLRELPAGSEPHWIVDFTLGGGGHTGAILSALARERELAQHRLLAFDRDRSAIDRSRAHFWEEISSGRLELRQAPFSETVPWLSGKKIMGMVADLGISSDQLNEANRGLSFLRDGPLDMRMDPERGKSCAARLSEASEKDIAEVLNQYGEERHARRIAHFIVSNRAKGSIPKTTRELADLVVRAYPPGGRHGRIHAATRTFQAFRIWVNAELDELDSLLQHAIMALQPGGRAVVLSFHSLEDRRVKQAFRQSDRFRVITKKPLRPDKTELAENPRARSAKMRIAEKI